MVEEIKHIYVKNSGITAKLIFTSSNYYEKEFVAVKYTNASRLCSALMLMLNEIHSNSPGRVKSQDYSLSVDERIPLSLTWVGNRKHIQLNKKKQSYWGEVVTIQITPEQARTVVNGYLKYVKGT